MRKKPRRFGERRRSRAFDKGEESRKAFERQAGEEFAGRTGCGKYSASRAVCGAELVEEMLLKFCDLLIEAEDFRGEGLGIGKVLRAANPCGVIRSKGLRGLHLRAGDEPTTSLYQAG